jgi:energy-coupling factor transporter ATP-binding protein EcfA2
VLNDDQLMRDVAQIFDIPRLKKDMEKYTKITPAPWEEFLCILAGLSVEETAKKLCKDKTGVYNSLGTRGIKNALVELLNLEDCKNMEYERIPQKLLKAGYGIEQKQDQQKINSELSPEIFKQVLEDKIKKLTTNSLLGDLYLDTESLYVPLGLVERKQKPHHGDIKPEHGSAFYRLNNDAITREFTYEEFLDEVVTNENSSKSQGRRLAIIGEPGSGKTTRLQQIARWLFEQNTDNRVIWVSLAELQGKTLEEYLLTDWLRNAHEHRKTSETQQDELVEEFKQGNIWLLLDGIDEIGSSGLSLFDKLPNWIKRAKIIVTCRLNIWDGSPRALSGFDIYYNDDFNDEQQKQFVINFLKNENDAQSLIEGLNQPGKERIKDLVKNPLRLTLICYWWQSHKGSLPDTKADLYGKFVEIYYDWKKVFETQISDSKKKEFEKALGRLAIQGLDRDKSHFRFTKKQINEVLGEVDEGMFKLAIQLGWLNNVGLSEEKSEKIYTFFHPSFQEYFAALAIDDWTFFLNHNNEDPNPFKKYNNKDCVYRVFETQWKEVICYWIGLEEIDDNKKEEFLNNLYGFKDGLININLFKNTSLILSLYFVSQYTQYKKINCLIDDGFNSLEDELYNNEVRKNLFAINSDCLRDKILFLIKNNDKTNFLSSKYFSYGNNDKLYQKLGNLFRVNQKFKKDIIFQLKKIIGDIDNLYVVLDPETIESFGFEKPEQSIKVKGMLIAHKYEIASHLIFELDDSDKFACNYNKNYIPKSNNHANDEVSKISQRALLSYFYNNLESEECLQNPVINQICPEVSKLIIDSYKMQNYDYLIQIILNTVDIKTEEQLHFYLAILTALLILSLHSFQYDSYNLIEQKFFLLINDTHKKVEKDPDYLYYLYEQFCLIWKIVKFYGGIINFNSYSDLIQCLKRNYFLVNNNNLKSSCHHLDSISFMNLECLKIISKQLIYPDFFKAWSVDLFLEDRLFF